VKEDTEDKNEDEHNELQPRDELPADDEAPNDDDEDGNDGDKTDEAVDEPEVPEDEVDSNVAPQGAGQEDQDMANDEQPPTLTAKTTTKMRQRKKRSRTIKQVQLLGLNPRMAKMQWSRKTVMTKQRTMTMRLRQTLLTTTKRLVAKNNKGLKRARQGPS
jgi:hypothetical protein